MKFNSREGHKLVEMIKKRNARLNRFLSYLSKNSSHDFRIINDPNNPKIVMDDFYCLSAYVKNFNLYFLDNPDDDNCTLQLKLTKTVVPDIDNILETIENANHRRLYKIRHINTDLYVSGYNFFDKSDRETMFPVFSRYNMKLYFRRERAEEIIDKFEDYPLIVE